jgi:hypothetical protein
MGAGKVGINREFPVFDGKLVIRKTPAIMLLRWESRDEEHWEEITWDYSSLPSVGVYDGTKMCGEWRPVKKVPEHLDRYLSRFRNGNKSIEQALDLYERGKVYCEAEILEVANGRRIRESYAPDRYLPPYFSSGV